MRAWGFCLATANEYWPFPQATSRISSVGNPSVAALACLTGPHRLRALHGRELDRYAVQHRVPRERIYCCVIREHVAVGAGVSRCDVEARLRVVVTPPVRDAHHPGHHRIRDLDRDLYRPPARAHPRAAAVIEAEPVGVLRMHVSGAPLAPTHQVRYGVPPRVVRAKR